MVDFINLTGGTLSRRPSGVTLDSITISPSNPTLHEYLDAEQQFTATGHYSDGSTSDITSLVMWTSSDVDVATIETAPDPDPGLAAVTGAGTTTIAATIDGVSGDTTLEVASLDSIAVTPSSGVHYTGTTQQFEAEGTWSDAHTADVTALATWSSGTTSALTISNGAGTEGLASLVGVAVAVVVTAVVGAINGTATVTVGADFTVLAAGAATLPNNLTFTRSGSGYSVQTSETTVVTADLASSDVPRVGRAAVANALALVFEEARTNTVKDNRDPTTARWTAGGMTVTRPSGTAPDGDATTQTAFSGTSFANFQGYANDGVTYRITMWVRSTTGASISARRQFGTANTDYTAAAHARVGNTYASVATSFFEPANSLPGGQNIQYDLGQREAGLFESEVVVAVGASNVTRNGEHLEVSVAITDSGQVRLYVRGRPKGSSAQYGADMYLWCIDANNYCRVSSSTGAITIAVDGVTYTTAVAMSWAANDLIEIFVGAGGSIASTASYRIGGAGAWTTLSTGSPTAFGDITQSGVIELLCSGTTNQFTGRWEKTTFYRAGETPVS